MKGVILRPVVASILLGGLLATTPVWMTGESGARRRPTSNYPRAAFSSRSSTQSSFGEAAKAIRQAIVSSRPGKGKSEDLGIPDALRKFQLALGKQTFAANEHPFFTLLPVTLPAGSGALTEEDALTTILLQFLDERTFEEKLLESVFSKNSDALVDRLLFAPEIQKELLATPEGKRAAKSGNQTGLRRRVAAALKNPEIRQDIRSAMGGDPSISAALQPFLDEESRSEVARTIVKNFKTSKNIDASMAAALDQELAALTPPKLQDIAVTLGSQIAGSPIANDIAIASTVLGPAVPPEVPSSGQDILSVKIKGHDGSAIPANYHFERGSIALVLDPVRKFTPGLYTLEVTVRDPFTGASRVITQDFSWGVVAMNPDSDRYFLGQTALIGIGVLDDAGGIVCDASLQLTIESPSGHTSLLSTKSKTIVKNTSCGQKLPGITTPDYQASARLLEPGTYILNLEVTTKSGKRTFPGTIIVDPDPPYTITRRGATRLWPFAPSPMDLTVWFREDFTGSISEIVPGDFAIVRAPGARITEFTDERGRGKLLTWTGHWKAGSQARLQYVYDAPNTSPEFYLLGPVRLGTRDDLAYEETRSWQIANDNEDLSLWSHRKKITISNANVDADLTNFPLYVKFTSDIDLGDFSQNDGDDVRFTAGDGFTILKHEEESWSGGAGTAVTANYWVKVPIISGTVDTTIYVYYGNAAATDGADAANVWDANFISVYHLGENGHPYADSKGTNNSTSTTPDPSQAVGKIGNGQSFNGSQRIELGTSSTLEPSELTVSVWVKRPTSVSWNSANVYPFASKATSWDSANGWYLEIIGSVSRSPQLVVSGDDFFYYSAAPDTVFPENTWKHISASFKSSDNSKAIYIDGSSQSLTLYNTPDVITSSANTKYIQYVEAGANQYGASASLDELRISDVTRSAAWVKFEYYNTGSTTNELTIEGQDRAVPFLDGYTKRKKITINNANVDADLTDFPVLVKFANDAEIGAAAQADGEDIRFTTSTGTYLLKYERESFSVSGGNATGIFWVKVPRVYGAENTDIYIYYGKSDATDGQDVANTWDANYKAVWHMGTSDSLSGTDSTSNANTASVNGTISASTGKISGAGNFNGSTGYMTTGLAPNTELGQNFTVEAWVYPDTQNNYRGVAGAHIGSYQGFEFMQYQDNYLPAGRSAGWVSNGGNSATWANGAVIQYSNATWSHVVATYANASSTETITAYLNGAQGDQNTTNSFTLTHLSYFWIGKAFDSADRFFDGQIDEFRVSSVVRSAAWIKFEYNNMNSAGNELTFAAEQTETSPSLEGWRMRKTITIDNTYADADLTNFPLRVSFSNDADIGNWAKSDGTDIRFTADDGKTLLKFERESWSGGSGSVASGTFWVRVPTVFGAADTTIYIYYGKPDATDGQNASAVWDTNYMAVYHLNETGTNPTVYDSTANNNDSTSQTWTPSATGKIGGAGSFDGTNSNIVIGTSSTLKPTGDMTVQAWVKPSSLPDYAHIISMYDNPGGNNDGWLLRHRLSNKAMFSTYADTVFTQPSPDGALSTTSISTSDWQFLSGVRDGTSYKLYFNTTAEYSETDSDGPVYSGSPTGYIGAINTTTSYRWNGLIDEIRVSNTPRSASWIKFEYNNINSADNELTFGSNEFMMPWLTGYTKRKWISTQVGTMDSQLTNFPFLVKFTNDGDLGDSMQADGDDIRFTNSDGTTLLKWEEDRVELIAGSASGAYWVKLPKIPTTGTGIYMYYGKSDATDASDAANVWDANFKRVYHFGALALSTTDSTGNANGTNYNSIFNSAGKVGGAVSMDGNGDYIDMASTNLPTGNSAMTLESWVKTSANAPMENIFWGNATTNQGIYTGIYNDRPLFGIWGGTPNTQGSTGYANGAWHYIVGQDSLSDGTNTLSLYMNGSYVTNGTTNSQNIGTTYTYIGKSPYAPDNYDQWNGLIDEVRISNIARPAAWIEFTYSNSNNADNEQQIWAEEALAAGASSSAASSVASAASSAASSVASSAASSTASSVASSVASSSSSSSSSSAGCSPVTISGVLYRDEGVTPISGESIGLSINGAAPANYDTTDASGNFAFCDSLNTNDVITLFVNDSAWYWKAVTVSSYLGAPLTLDMFAARVILNFTGTITNDMLNIADNSGDGDITAYLSCSSSRSATFLYPSELFIWPATTYNPGGTVSAYDVDINGTFTMGSHDVLVSGNWDAISGSFTGTNQVMFTLAGGNTGLWSNGSSFNNFVLNTGLVGYWSLDENTGTLANDASGYDNSGSLLNMEAGDWSTTTPPTAFTNESDLSFGGSNEFVQVPDAPELNLSTGFTLSAWIKTTAATNTIIAKDDTTGNRPYVLYIDSGEAGVYVSKDGAVGQAQAGTVNDNVWHHIAATYVTNSYVKIYVDGVLLETDTSVPIGLATRTHPVTIGCYAATAPNQYCSVATIDDVRIYNSVITDQQIQALAVGSVPGRDDSSLTFQDNLTIAGDLTIASGRLKPNSTQTITLSGSWLNYGGMVNGINTTTFDGTGTENIQSGGQEFGSVTLAAAGTWTLRDRLNIDGTYTQSAGTLDVSSARNHKVFAEDFDQTAGTFTARNGFLTIDGASNATITASSSLYDFAVEDPTENGLVGYWKFDEGQGVYTYDSSPNANPAGFFNTPFWTTATASTITFKNDYAVSFDGTDDFLSIDDSVPLSITGDLTVSAWIKPDSVTYANEAIIIAKWEGSKASYDLALNDDEIQLRVSSDGSSYNNFAQTDAANITTGAWRHVAAVYNASAQTVTLYVDGIVAASTVTGTIPSSIFNSDGKVRIGGWTTGYYFDGVIDDARIYNRSLSGIEVARLGAGKYATGEDGSATITLGANLDVDDDLFIQSGILAGSTRTITLGDDWNNFSGSGGFSYGTSTVTLNGTTQTLTGTGSFYALGKTVAAADTLTFHTGDRFNVTSSLSLNGASNNLLTLNTTAGGKQTFLALTNGESQTLTYLDVIDNNAGSGATLFCTTGCVDSDNNVNWCFNGTCPLLAGYCGRKKLTIDNTNVDSDLTNFPVYVSIANDAAIGSAARPDGYDIVFTKSDGETLIPFERESYSVTGGQATGNFWVRVPFIDGSADTTFYMYYGKPSASDTQNAAGVWDSNYLGVWHLGESGNPYLDSTSNNRDSTSGTYPTQGTGKIGNGQTFNGTNTIIYFSDTGLPTSGTSTIEGWIKSNDQTDYNLIVGYGTTDTNKDRSLGTAVTTGYMYTSTWGPTITYSADIVDNTWHYGAAVYSGSNNWKLWSDGNNTTGSLTTATVLNNLTIGANDDATYPAWTNGILDEIRVSNTARSDAWVKFTYNNIAQADQEMSGVTDNNTCSVTKKKHFFYFLE